VLPTAVVFVIGGALSCFAGYRLFRIVLGINGFILGALIASQAMGTHSAFNLAVAALAGGIVGALVMIIGWFVGIALSGAAVGAMAVNLAWRPFGHEPSWMIVVGAAMVGALVALAITRYMIIVATAFGGAWTLLLGAFTIADRQTIVADKTWVVYPLGPASEHWWVVPLWLALSLVGVIAQILGKHQKSKKK
jgi:hypothetical protein